MAEEKKRVRPTAAQVKILEDSIAALKEVIDSKDKMLREYEKSVIDLKNHIRTLEQSNGSMESELKRNVNRNEDEMVKWKERALMAEADLMTLSSRGFWARLFNRK